MSTITRYAQAWTAGDLATLLDCYDPEVVVHYGGTSPFRGTHRGRDAFVGVLAETAQRSRRELVRIDQVHDDGDQGALFVTERIELDGVTSEVQRALRYRVAHDRIVECWLFDADQHLVDRAWS